jgi:hypothetical protein
VSRPLRGERYLAKGARPEIVAYIERLWQFSFEEAKRFYREVVPHMNGAEMALLGCNDRYFLLTGVLNRPDMIHPWQYERAREVETYPDGYIDLWSREHGKSSWITFAGAIQEILCDPEITIGIFSNTKDIARPFLAQIKRELESNETLIALYPDVLWQSSAERKASPAAPSWSLDTGITVKRKGNPKEATVEAHGLIDAMPTGRHFRLMIFDDVVTEKNVTNPEMIAKTADRFELADNLGQAEGSRRQIAGTRYSYADYYGEMISNGIATPRVKAATEDGTPDGVPVFWTQDTWERKKKTQRRTMAAQLLQNPLAGSENTFRVQWLKPYWVRPSMLNVYILGDPSRGHNKTSDRTALPVIGIDPLSNKYLLDGYCHRMPLSERWNKLKELHKKWSNMTGVQLVKVGYERYGMQSDDEYFEERMRKEKVSFTIETVNWTGERGGQSKNYRVERLEPDFREGSFFVPARVWHQGAGNTKAWARWYLEDGSDEIHYRPCPGLHELERRAKANSEHHRLFDPIRRIDEDGAIYDLTRVFFEEFRFFPFSPRKDLIDATSRVYDMEPMPAVPFETIEVLHYVDS